MKIGPLKRKVVAVSGVLFSVLLLLSFSGINGIPENSSEPKTIEELGPYLFKLIQKNDSAAFNKLLLSKAELESILNASSMRAEEKKSVMNEYNNGEFTEKVKKTFRIVVREFAKSGASCSSPELVRNEIKIRLEDKLESGRLKYEFKCGTEKFELSCSDILKLPSGLRLVSRLRFQNARVEEEMMRDYMKRDSIVADSIRQVDMARMLYEMELLRLDSLAADSVYKADMAKQKNKTKGTKGTKGKK